MTLILMMLLLVFVDKQIIQMNLSLFRYYFSLLASVICMYDLLCVDSGTRP